jgi:large subunit ribosomal protein L22
MFVNHQSLIINQTMEYTSIQKNITDSPRKLRLVADMIRKMKPAQALETLQFTNKAAALPLAKAIKTALANAKTDDVVFKSLEINEGMKLKRYRAGTAGRGRGRPYKKRWSHIKIVLTDAMPMEEVKESKGARESKGAEVLKPKVTKENEVKIAEEKAAETKDMKAEEVKEEVAEKVEEEIEKNIEDKTVKEGQA